MSSEYVPIDCFYIMKKGSNRIEFSLNEKNNEYLDVFIQLDGQEMEFTLAPYYVERVMQELKEFSTMIELIKKNKKETKE